jgi:hydrogenase maturation factor
MNLLYGEIVETFSEDGMQFGKIRVGGAIRRVSLDLLVEPRAGEGVLVCDGVALSKVDDQKTGEIKYVSGNSG